MGDRKLTLSPEGPCKATYSSSESNVEGDTAAQRLEGGLERFRRPSVQMRVTAGGTSLKCPTSPRAASACLLRYRWGYLSTGNPQARPRIVYVSYDGAGEPLGRSQILAYLVRLARSCNITLISFEKDRASRPDTAELLGRAGIRWVPLSYHRFPPVVSTAWDVVVGTRALRREVRRTGADVVHARSYVPALMAVRAGRGGRRRWRFVFDIRAFWVDERQLAGAWSKGSLLYRLAKRWERRFFAEADAVVTLTHASVPQIRNWTGPRDLPVEVIPTCAEIDHFAGGRPRSNGPYAVWSGSVGSFYRFDLAVRFVKALRVPFLVLTRQVDSARAQLDGVDAEVRAVAHEDIADELRPGDIGMCFYERGGLGNLGRSPTRVAEYLASGMIVAATPGIGDLDGIIRQHNLGVLIVDESDDGLMRAADMALALAGGPEARALGPQIARERYSSEDGANAYLALYRQLLARGHPTDAADGSSRLHEMTA